MADPNVGQLIATAWEAIWTDGPVDNIFSSQALLFLFKDGGYKEEIAGGRLFEASVEYAGNGTFKSMSELGTLDVTRYDTFDASRFEQKIWAGTVVFSELEDLRNAAGNRKFDVVKAKMKNAISSSMEGLEKILFLDGTGSGGKPPVSTCTDDLKVHGRAALFGVYAQQALSAIDTTMGDEGLDPPSSLV